jgi:hypothetical protein
MFSLILETWLALRCGFGSPLKTRINFGNCWLVARSRCEGSCGLSHLQLDSGMSAPLVARRGIKIDWQFSRKQARAKFG